MGCDTETRLLTETEAAKLLNVSPRTVWQLRKDGKLACVLIGRSIRYDINDVKQFIEASKSQVCA